MKFSAAQIAGMIQAEIIGDPEVAVSSFAKIEEAGPGQLTFLANPKYQKYLTQSQASVIIINQSFIREDLLYPNTLLTVPDAYAAFTQLMQIYQNIIRQASKKSGIHTNAIIEESAEIHHTAYIGVMTYVANHAVIGEESVIEGQCYIGQQVSIGKNCHIHPGVKILDRCIIEDNVVIHSGAVIGSDGFGFAPDNTGVYSKVPQMGNVVIRSNVEIGANTAIDRATMGSTIIGKGVKIDNLVQIAHNVIIEDNTVIAAQAGISGSTKIGRSCIIGGQAGIVGHISLADGTKINAQSGVAKTVSEPNKALTGSPAFDYYASIKTQALTRKLPKLFKRLEELEKRNQS
ncbi:MAG: UDP-3-O-(3-hydroxymyristoyl)glucosamine N-acyltransferase [Taibaiella sp.]|nr:UDP-3-O-(3-hydroxymyristoyl)glucosamine N-acyltransferase [Taibaiella sp.]